MLTTRRCLLSAARNPDLDESDWERLLGDWFGVDQVHWLDHGRLEGDDTDGHVDMLARFAPEDTILHASCDDPNDPHHSWLGELAAELKALRTRASQPYRLLPLPLPPAILDREGRRLPASYANFLVINDAVLVPSYGASDHDTYAVSYTHLTLPTNREV